MSMRIRLFLLFSFGLFTSTALGQLVDAVTSSYATGVFDASAAEIVDYHPGTQRLFFVNANAAQVGVLSMADPNELEFLFYVELGSGSPNSVAVVGDAVAVAVAADTAGVAGEVRFFDTDGAFLHSVPVGFLPDALTVSDDGTLLAVANEGEPDYNIPVDPEGSATIVDLSAGVTNAVATQVPFTSIQPEDLDESIRIFGPDATIAQDLEPEYVAFSADNSELYVSCQENNAMVVIDVATASVVDIWGLGFKNHLLAGQGLDPSNADGEIQIANWPVKGMFQPDAIHPYTVDGVTYLLTANEGDAREYFFIDSLGNYGTGIAEEARVSQVELDPSLLEAFPGLQDNANLGRLKMTETLGDTDGDGDYDEIYAFGARSFSIYTADGQQVFDSGDDFEAITASLIPDNFNSTNDENGSFDDRSDDKGPEPEGIEIGTIGASTYAFIGLERVGGVMVYDITDPLNPVYVRYLQNRDYDGVASDGTAGDLGPEGLVFVGAEESPDGHAYIVTSNEVSGTVTAHRLVEASEVVEGCTDDGAFNFDPAANIDDGTCEFPDCDPFISEYGVGPGLNRWIEIYNPTGQDVDLDDYAWPAVYNSNLLPGQYENWNTFNAGHILEAGDVYILCHPQADSTLLNAADQTLATMPDGNVGFALVKGTEDDFEVVDFFANWEGDNDEEGAWSVCGDPSVRTNLVTLVRKPAFDGNPNPSGEDLSTSDGETDFPLGSLAPGVCEWEVYPVSDFSHIGSHVYAGECLPPVVGCMVPVACNYDADANENDLASCDYDSCAGCMYPGACNFDPDALVDDASCFFLPGDVTGDGVVGAADLLVMLGAYFTSCP